MRFKHHREAEDQALAKLPMWKACNGRKYDKLVDPLLSQLAPRAHTLYKKIKEKTSSVGKLGDRHVDVSTLEIHREMTELRRNE